MGFHQPLWLLTLLAVAPLALLLVWALRRRNRTAVRFAAADMLDGLVPRVGVRKWIPPAGLVAALVLAAVALAGPFMTTTQPKEQATIVLAIDVSNSMMAKDVSPDRITAAKNAARDLVKGVPNQMKVGVVAFAGTAQVLTVPTRDHQRAIAAVDTLRLQNETAIGEGIDAGLDALSATGGGDGGGEGAGAVADAADHSQAIVLLSDGQTTSGTPSQVAAARAQQAGVPVFTVAFGTDHGEVEIDGQVIPVQVDENELRTIAQMTGGDFFRANDAGALDRIFSSIGSRLGTEEVQQDLWVVFAVLAALALVAALVLSIGWFGRLA
ncbi:MAG: VWA domain-containing protein [Acidimicrobiia bacterium]